MSVPDLKAILGNFFKSYTGGIITLCGYGEPFCNPGIYDAIDILSPENLDMISDDIISNHQKRIAENRGIACDDCPFLAKYLSY